MSVNTISKIFNNTVIEILIGEFIDSDYDAMVIPTNSRLLPSGDLRCKVLKEAGAKVQIECNTIVNKIGSVPITQAVITSGGNLKVKNIIHVNEPKFGSGKEAKKLALATWNCLKTADEEGLRSIIFPPICKELYGFDIKLISKAMLESIKKYILEKNKNINNIMICLDNLPDYKEFKNALDELGD
ncbi:MAG: macro domain-containing protein [Promethearchaeota archaeon]